MQEGVNFERLDKAVLGFGLPMGPFTLMDEIGLDVGYKVALLLEQNFGERMKVAEILKKVYNQKWFGKKMGKGFYVHKGKDKQPNKEIYGLISPGLKSALDDVRILKRMLYRMINEAALCLEEKVCLEPSDVDIGMIMGAGFPASKGGLLRYADNIGCDKIVADLEKFKTEFNAERFAPCKYLLDLAGRREKFYA